MKISDSIATEINNLSKQAIASAGEAVEHARKAGELLLEVKNQLPHGQFLQWVKQNITVSLRQAQRYMAAAQGKALVLKDLTGKYDKVSHLIESMDELEFLRLVGKDGDQEIELAIIPIDKTFAHIAYLKTSVIDGQCKDSELMYFKRGISRAFFAEMVKQGHFPIENATVVDRFSLTQGLTKNPYVEASFDGSDIEADILHQEKHHVFTETPSRQSVI